MRGSCRFLMLVFAVLLCRAVSVSDIQAQQQYPVRPIRLIVPSAPGGGTDITARLISPRLSEYLGQQVVVENRAGAGTMMGSETVARAKPDGYTLLMGISTLAINPAIYKKVPYDALTDFAPISLVVTLPNILVVHPSLGVKSVKELISYSRLRPGQVNYASAGVGTSPHLSMELFLSMTGLKMVHVAYKGSGQGLIEVIGGHVPVSMPSMLSGTPFVKNGQLIGLGITGSKRTVGEPDIPTIAEAGVPGYEAVQWFGVLAPKGTPREIITKVHGAVVRALTDPDIRKALINDGADPIGSSPEEFAAYIRSETEKWVKVVRDTGLDQQ
jgi:tripartite-type tricarboxylate transporter receptor subunit TctC